MPHYRFADSYDAEGEAGARSLERIHEENVVARRQAQHEQLQRAHEAFLEAEYARKTAEAVARANEKTMLQKRLAADLPLLIGINPSDKDAMTRYTDFYSKHAADIAADPVARALYEEKGRGLEAHRKVGETAEAAEAARQKREADVLRDLKSPPEGTTAKGARLPSGVNVETQAEVSAKAQAAKQKKIDDIQSRMDKEIATHRGYLNTIAAAEPKAAIPAPLLKGKNMTREHMMRYAAQLKALDPKNAELAKSVDDEVKQVNLDEHGILESHLGQFDETSDKGFAKRRPIIAEINPLKKALGMQEFKTDPATGNPVMESFTDPVTNKTEMRAAMLPVSTEKTTASTILPGEAPSAANPPVNPNLPPAGLAPAPAAPIAPPGIPAPVGTAVDVTPIKKALPPIESFFPPPK